MNNEQLPTEYSLEELAWMNADGTMDVTLTAITHLPDGEFENWIARLRAARMLGGVTDNSKRTWDEASAQLYADAKAAGIDLDKLCPPHMWGRDGLANECTFCNAPRHWSPPDNDEVDDGFGTSASAWCEHCRTKTVIVVRPGDIRCGTCEN